VCQSLGLNPLIKPFEYLWLNGKLRLYTLRDCADQLRRLHGISISITNRERLNDVAYWPDRVETHGGRRRELPRLLRRYCRGATRVVVYEARETIWDVRHVTRALERWQRAGGHV
jgi:hypothetical protein